MEEKCAVLTKEVNGIKIGFLSYTYDKDLKNTNDVQDYAINIIDKEDILTELKFLKLQNVDVICANLHCGDGYTMLPNEYQKEMENFLFENDVDIVYMSHPYVLQPIENKQYTKTDGTTKNVFTIYSLGNFVSGQTATDTDTSIILNLKVSKDNSHKIIYEYDYVPICMINNYSKEKKYKLLATYDAIYDYENNENTDVSKPTYQKLKESLEYVKEVLGE